MRTLDMYLTGRKTSGSWQTDIAAARWAQAVHTYAEAMHTFMGVLQLRAATGRTSPLLTSETSEIADRQLTPREYEVAALIARGFTNRQIADALVITQGTAANHVAHILGRLDLRTRTQVAVWVLQDQAA